MFRVDASRIRTLLFERKLSVEGLARQAQLNVATTRKALTDGAKLSVASIARLAEFFGVTGEELILKG